MVAHRSAPKVDGSVEQNHTRFSLNWNHKAANVIRLAHAMYSGRAAQLPSVLARTQSPAHTRPTFEGMATHIAEFAQFAIYPHTGQFVPHNCCTATFLRTSHAEPQIVRIR
jgi:hypothetical protein